MKRVGNQMLFEDFAIAENLLAGRSTFFDHFTAVDAYFFWCFRRALSFKLDVSRFSNCMRHFEHVQKRASVQRVFRHEQAVQEAFAHKA